MFQLKNTIFTLKDAWQGIKYVYQISQYRDLMGLLILAILFVVLKLYASSPADTVFFLLFIYIIVYWKLDSRVSISFGLGCLILCPILLILSNKNIMLTGEYYAEKFAVFAYYFLCIGVVFQIIEYVKDRKPRQPHKHNKKSIKCL